MRLDVIPIEWDGLMNVDAFVDLRGLRRVTELLEQRRQDPSANTAEVSIISDSLKTKATVAFMTTVPSGMPMSVPLNTKERNGLTWSFLPTLGKTYSFTKYIGVATAVDKDLCDPMGCAGGNSTQVVNSMARTAAASAVHGRGVSYKAILIAHENTWHRIWQTDILVDDLHPTLQATIHASEYNLLSNVRPGARSSHARALAGCGLRRTELLSLELDQIEQREGRWVIRKRVVWAVAMRECHNYEGVIWVGTERFHGSRSLILLMG